MRRLSLRAVFALTVPAFLASPAALAQYASDYGRRGGEDPPAAIALFSDENYYGDVRDVYDPFTTLKDLGFGDRARSVAVFGGQWELCEDWNFTGRCVFIREDVSDLGWFGLAGRVTSVRPVYEYTEAQHGLMFTRDRQGYIRYADNEVYGYDTWTRGYASSWGISTSHYGYSPDYYRYGYYSPAWGYDPYGFAWGPRGTIRYTKTYRYHPRPSVLNPYWSGWDYHRTDWRRGNWSWRGKGDWRDHRDDHRDDDRKGRGGRDRDDDDYRGDGDGRGGGWRPGDTGGGRGDRPRRDLPDAGGPAIVSPIPADPRTERRGEGRRSLERVTSPLPAGPVIGREGRGSREGREDRRGGRLVPADGAGADLPVVIPPPVSRPEGRPRGGDPGALLGGPGSEGYEPRRRSDDWRRERSEDDRRGSGDDRRRSESDRGSRRSEDGASGGGSARRAEPPVVAVSPPPPPPLAEPRRSETRERRSEEGRDSFRDRDD